MSNKVNVKGNEDVEEMLDHEDDVEMEENEENEDLENTETNELVYRQEDIENMVVDTLKSNEIDYIGEDETKLVIDTVWDTIYNALVDGYIVKLHGKGQFYLSQRSARVGRNPHTGEEHDIPAREIMAFRVSPAVSKRLRAEREKQKEK